MTTTTHRPTEATCPKRIAALLSDGSREVRPCRLEAGHDGVCKYAVDTAEDFEEQDQQQVRDKLGLRPIAYDMSAEPGTHPDQRPCPSWCWVGQSDEYDHEIDPRSPFVAMHSYDVRLGIASSRYRGHRSGQLATPATIEAHLEQPGQSRPSIEVSLRHWPAGQMEYEQRLSLGITDAQELATLLLYLVNLADNG